MTLATKHRSPSTIALRVTKPGCAPRETTWGDFLVELARRSAHGRDAKAAYRAVVGDGVQTLSDGTTVQRAEEA